MKVVTYINVDWLERDKNPNEGAKRVAIAARSYLQGVVCVNQMLLRQAREHGKPVPPLYQSGVKFRREPWGSAFEEFATLDVVLERLWGDCDDLVPWRVAELKEGGEKASIRVHWRPSGDGNSRYYHVTVRRAPTKLYPTGLIEDPSRFLGM